MVHRTKVHNLIRETHGKIFSVQFIKMDNTVRDMVCRTEVTKGVKGTGHPLSLNTDVIKVFDVQKNAFRSIALSRIKKLKIKGVEHIVTD